MTEYWFARRFPVGNPRSGMAPVHWKGWLVVAVFLLAMIAGAATFAWLGADGRVAEGAAVFALFAFGAMIFFVTLSREKGDRIRTVDDYRKERARV
jgi:hypothetical protein